MMCFSEGFVVLQALKALENTAYNSEEERERHHCLEDSCRAVGEAQREAHSEEQIWMEVFGGQTVRQAEWGWTSGHS